MDARYLLPLHAVSMADLPRVGGKTASLGEMTRALASLGVPVPEGYALTAQAAQDALDAARAWPTLHRLLDGLDKRDVRALARAGAAARALVLEAPMPVAVEAGLREVWQRLQAASPAPLRVAVRSSATAEDLPQASFAGQHESVLNVASADALVQAVRTCQASLYTDRAIAYRIDNGFDHFKVRLAVAVQRMVRSDLGASGVVFTRDTESGHPGFVLVTGAWGLGEHVVQGRVEPDEFLIHKEMARSGHGHVLRRRMGRKARRLVIGADDTLVDEATPPADQARPCLTDAQVNELVRAALVIEDHYSQLAGQWQPMDIEWAQDGPDGRLYVVQARPDTSQALRPTDCLERYVLDPVGTKAAPGRAPEVLVTGQAVGERIGAGRVRRILDASQLARFEPGEVLVSPSTSPDWEPVMKTASALVTESGGRTCHAAIVARELGIPAVVGAAGALQCLKDGREVTLSCAEGETGQVYAGTLPFHVERTPLGEVPHPATSVMVNIGNPGLALSVARLPAAGVGLARIEFIIGEAIGLHPLAALHPERIADAAERRRLEATWRRDGHTDGRSFFIDRLAEGVATIAAAFHPRPVVVRLSDFKSSEYAALAGGSTFEPAEANPMLGWRGAARYLHPDWAEAFAMECEALHRVRQEMGLSNVQLMVPFCRSPEEGRAVLERLASHGLARGRDGLQVLVMCEIPANVLRIDELCTLFDGISIGSNDLAQLALGVDRDSALVAGAFDEQDPGVLELMRQAIAGARRHGRSSGICGQAPSDHPTLARRLVEWGIGSISVTPDRLLATLRLVDEAERQVRQAGDQSTVAPLAFTTAS